MKIIIYADGSFKQGKQGNATIICNESTEKKCVLIYRSDQGKNSQQAEINSVIYGLEYVKEIINPEKQKVQLQINSDEISLVQFINKKLYIEWDKLEWRKSNKPIRSNIKLWYKLMLLINYFGQENISAVKVKSSEDKIHRIVDKAAHKMLLKKMPIPSGFYINELAGKYELYGKPKIIEIPEIKLDESKMPWCNNKKERILWINHVDQHVIDIPTKNIILTEEIHLKCMDINFSGRLCEYNKQGKIEIPVAVREIAPKKYALVMGIQRYFAAKILDLEVIPAVVVKENYNDFKTKMKEVVDESKLSIK